jgi:hypothetical protein
MAIFSRSMFNLEHHSILPRHCSFVCKITYQFLTALPVSKNCYFHHDVYKIVL